MPCYNVERYISDCLSSLINQADIDLETYEIICVNDGSTDNTLQILNDFSEKYGNIRVISTENGGVSAARNIGIKRAVGDYITFVDPDDAVPHNLLYNVKQILQNNPNTDALIGCFRSYPDMLFSEREDGCGNFDGLEIMESRDSIMSTCVKDISNGLNQGSVFAQFISKALLDDNGIRFQENLTIGEDEVFSFEVRYAAQKTVFVPEVFYYYRLREGSAMRASSSDLAIKRQISNKNKALFYKGRYPDDEWAKEYFIKAVNQTCFMLLFINDRKRVKEARRELAELGFYPPKMIDISCLQEKPSSLKLFILDRLKRMLKYPKLFWILWYTYGFRR